MTKFFKFLFGIVFLLIVMILAGMYVSRNWIVKNSVVYIGPKVTLTDISVESASFSFPCDIRLYNLIVKNPRGFNSPHAFKISELKLELSPMSLLSQTVVVNELIFTSPEINYEKSATSNNVDIVFDNIRSFARGDETNPSWIHKKQFQINRFIVPNGTVNTSITLIKDKLITSSLPEIEQKLIGAGTSNLSFYGTVDSLLKILEGNISKTVYGSLQDIGKDAQNLLDKVKGLFDN